MIDWTALSSQLTTPVQITDVNLWLQQCIRPFDAVSLSPVSLSLGAVSNYELFEQSSGLCMQSASCAFTNCTSGPFYDAYEGFAKADVMKNGFLAFYQSEQTGAWDSIYGPGVYPVLPDEDIVEAASVSEDSQLPAAVVHPEHPGDVSLAVRFAADNGLKVSVKTSGHNWMGSSTRKGTLLLNLSKLRKYALPETISDGIFECNTVGAGDDGGIVVVEPRMGTDGEYSISESVAAACKVALARGKPAIMRAGGGQIVDEGLRSIEEWNSDPSRPPLHAMTGSAGTVSLAGGWLASGGLGGSLGMRMYGVGVDQVLYVEMVLPDGQFVRFGPSTWTPAEGNQLYPQTTSVMGYCVDDDTADLSDESTWSWVDCSDQYDFDDLWFAIRGGGGGSYGVITSIYYQLHDKPGNLQSVYWPETLYRLDPSMPSEDKGTMMSEIIGFVFNFLYNPDRVGVSDEVSHSCSAPDSPIALECYNGAGKAFVDAWDEYFGMLETAKMISVTIPSPQLKESSSYASTAASTHNGRIQDSTYGHTLTGNANPLVIPIDVLQTKFDAFMDIYMPCLFASYGALATGKPEDLCLHLAAFTPYFYGGGVQYASDGTDAYPSHRRNGAFHVYVLQEDVRKQFKRLVWGVEDNAETYSNGNFPGIFCHNHLFYSTSPKKSNWLEDCNGSTPGGSGTPLADDDCMSLQEAAFGTETLRRLEKIHSNIDPLRMFQTSDGPGYAEGGADTSSAGIYLTVISFFVTLSTTLILI